jgi:hypothetical protein
MRRCAPQVIYRDQGRNLTLFPGFTFEFRRRTRRFRPRYFIISTAGSS